MFFIRELKRFWFLNLSKPKKVILPIILNILIISVCFILLKDWISSEYIFAYLIVWLFFSTQMSMYKDLQLDKQSGKFKYYFLSSNTFLVKVYNCRYLIYLLKNCVLLYGIVCILKMGGMLMNGISIRQVFIITVAFYSIFFMLFILSLLGVIYDKLSIAINFIRGVIFFYMLVNSSYFLPMGGVINNIANCFLGYTNDNINLIYVLLNFIIYSIVGYLISILFIKKMKLNIVG